MASDRGEHGSPWDASVFPGLDAACGGERATRALLGDAKLSAWFLMDHFSTASTKRVRDSGTWVLDPRIRQVPMGLAGSRPARNP